jgi:hypothetical protein
MRTRRTLAVAIAVGGLALLVIGVFGFDRLHAFLSAGAGHSVTAGYVDRFRMRALICAFVSLAIAAVAWFRELPPHRPLSIASPSPLAWLIIAIGAAARLPLLFIAPRYDEAFTINEFVRHGPAFFLLRYTAANNHVFHTLLVWIVRVAAGDRLWALRLPAFIAGIGVLVATYALARRLGDETTALVATALAAAASPLVEYSSQARGYTILTLAFLLLYLIDDELLAGIALALGAWTIPTMIYAAAAWAVWAIVTQRAWRRVVNVSAIGGALAFLLYLPILVVTGTDSITSNGNTLSVPYHVLVKALPATFVDLAQQWSLSFTVPLAIVLAAAAVIAMIRRAPAALPFACAVAAIAVLLLITRKVPFPRVWIFVMPLFLIAAASAFTFLRRRSAHFAIAAAAAVLAFNAWRVTNRFDFYEDPAMADAPAVARSIDALPADARVLVTTPLDAPFVFCAPGRIIQDRFDSDPAAVRAEVLRTARLYFVASTDASDPMAMYRALHLPHSLAVVQRFPHAVLYALRLPHGGLIDAPLPAPHLAP